jgi:cystathionine beta-synthase
MNDAEARGEIRPGGTIVEATSGNTGMGLALVAAVRGYKCVFVMPDKMSDEKIRALRAVGAKVVICPTDVEPEDPRSYYSVSRRIAEETPNAFLANQYHNPSNPESHYKSTGPELWAQTKGELDVFVSGMGTGGTLSGVGKFLKEKKPAIQIVGVDPIGSLYYDYVKTGRVTTAHPYKVEGIGEDFFPSTMNLKILDEVIRVTDKECFMAARDLVKREGILCGGSGGAAVIGAVKYAEMMNKPLKIVVLLPDQAVRYLTKYLDDEWMRQNGFLGPEPGLGRVSDLLATRPKAPLQVAQAKDPVKQIIMRMKEHGISQVPVLDGNKILGIVNERDLLQFFMTQDAKLEGEVGPLVDTQFSAVDLATPVATLSGLFNQNPVVLVVEQRELKAVITKIDLIEYMAKHLNAA